MKWPLDDTPLNEPAAEPAPEGLRRRFGARMAAASAVVLGAALVATRFPGERARHLALPVLVDPSSPGAAIPAADPDRMECRTEEVGRVGRRITALLPAMGGGLWVGTFDDGVVRLGSETTPSARAQSGRRRMVNALASDGATVWAATQGGLIGMDGPGAGQVLLGDDSVSALARAGGALYAGAGHGLYRVAGGAAEAVPATGPDGEALRVTALAAGRSPTGSARAGRNGPLAAARSRLWIGTSAGAYSVDLEDLTAATPAAWHPLVFGDPPAATNVVTALAVLGDAAVAGTDDGGLVRIGPRGEISAVRFADSVANQVNPGAAATSGSALAFGTQGGGLLLVRARGVGLELRRPSGLENAAVSATAADEESWIIGTPDGRVLRVACPATVGDSR